MSAPFQENAQTEDHNSTEHDLAPTSGLVSGGSGVSSSVGEANLSSLVEKDFSSLEAEALDVDSYVAKFRTQISGYLAIGFGITLALGGLWHAANVAYISHRMMNYSLTTEADSSDSDLDFDAYEKAFVMVGDTAKTLYAVLSPLAAAVTGFYFASKAEDDRMSPLEDD